MPLRTNSSRPRLVGGGLLQIDEWLDTLTPAVGVPGRSVELDPAAYELLQVEARRRHIEPEELAAELVRGALGPSAADGGEREKQRR